MLHPAVHAWFVFYFIIFLPLSDTTSWKCNVFFLNNCLNNFEIVMILNCSITWKKKYSHDCEDFQSNDYRTKIKFMYCQISTTSAQSQCETSIQMIFLTMYKNASFALTHATLRWCCQNKKNFPTSTRPTTRTPQGDVRIKNCFPISNLCSKIDIYLFGRHWSVFIIFLVIKNTQCTTPL